MLSTTQIINGYVPSTEKATLVNRTGAAIVTGQVVAFNLDFAAVSGQAMAGIDPAIDADGATGYVLGAAIAQTTENVCRLLAVSLGAVADNEYGLFVVKGLVKALVNGGNKGEFLTGTNAQVYLTPLTRTEILALTTAVSNICGFTLEDTSGSALALCYFDGETYKSWSAGDT